MKAGKHALHKDMPTFKLGSSKRTVWPFDLKVRLTAGSLTSLLAKQSITVVARRPMMKFSKFKLSSLMKDLSSDCEWVCIRTLT